MKRGTLNKTVKGVCRDLSFEGKGVAVTKDGVVFVDNLLPGEEAEIEITYKRNGALFGRIKKLDKLSKDRIQPKCKIASACGGCCFQHYDYDAQLRYKQAKVKDQFRKIAKMDVDVKSTIGMNEPYFYRNKIQMPFGRDKKGNIVCGFYKAKTHEIIPVNECQIEDKRSGHILQTLKRLMCEFHIDPYDEDSRKGIIRHTLIRTSFYKEEIMLVLVTNVDSFPSRGNFVKELVKECPEITTVVQNINRRDTNVILGEQERVLYGPGFIEDTLCGLSFRISAKSFYQTNPQTTEKLYEAAMVGAGFSGNEIVLDAYSGIGTIGLIASKYAKEVISVEIVKQAVKDAKANARRNGIDNFNVYEDDASEFIEKYAEAGRKIDVLFMDPPRKGSDQRFLDSVLKLKPRKVIYISCEPSTLARDVAYISGSYSLDSLQPFDMFPHSFHVETLAVLSLKV